MLNYSRLFVGSPFQVAVLAGDAGMALAGVFVQGAVDFLPTFVAASRHRAVSRATRRCSKESGIAAVEGGVDDVDVAPSAKHSGWWS